MRDVSISFHAHSTPSSVSYALYTTFSAPGDAESTSLNRRNRPFGDESVMSSCENRPLPMLVYSSSSFSSSISFATALICSSIVSRSTPASRPSSATSCEGGVAAVAAEGSAIMAGRRRCGAACAARGRCARARASRGVRTLRTSPGRAGSRDPRGGARRASQHRRSARGERRRLRGPRAGVSGAGSRRTAGVGPAPGVGSGAGGLPKVAQPSDSSCGPVARARAPGRSGTHQGSRRSTLRSARAGSGASERSPRVEGSPGPPLWDGLGSSKGPQSGGPRAGGTPPRRRECRTGH